MIDGDMYADDPDVLMVRMNLLRRLYYVVFLHHFKYNMPHVPYPYYSTVC